jgi:hypothetical protein
MTDAERRAAESGYAANRKNREIWSTESASSSKSDEETHRPLSPASMEYEIDSLEFTTKPAGF